MKRRTLIAGNWKMHNTPEASGVLAQAIAEGLGAECACDVVICPTFTGLDRVSSHCKDALFLGAQNMHSEDSGAFTGEVSAEMLKTLGVTYVILGHSERRTLFKETDTCVNKKVLKAQSSGLKPILCVGETLEERESGDALAVIKSQITAGLQGVKASEDMVIAYEPVWAIGTGKTATPEMAQEVHAAIRSMLTEIYDENIAAKIRILYGGSMKPTNAKDLLSQEDIDGGLIGGASLKADSFLEIVHSVMPLECSL